jgi:hypothetical protein
MNQSFYESRSKEKINDLMKEGQMSQAYSRSRSRKPTLLSRIPKIIVFVLAILWILQMIVR